MVAPHPYPSKDERKAWMAHHIDILVIAIVYTALGLTAFVVIVGGIVCVTDDQYLFKQYIADLRQMSNWVLAAAIVVAAKLIAPYVKVVRDKANGGEGS